MEFEMLHYCMHTDKGHCDIDIATLHIGICRSPAAFSLFLKLLYLSHVYRLFLVLSPSILLSYSENGRMKRSMSMVLARALMALTSPMVSAGLRKSTQFFLSELETCFQEAICIVLVLGWDVFWILLPMVRLKCQPCHWLWIQRFHRRLRLGPERFQFWVRYPNHYQHLCLACND